MALNYEYLDIYTVVKSIQSDLLLDHKNRISNPEGSNCETVFLEPQMGRNSKETGKKGGGCEMPTSTTIRHICKQILITNFKPILALATLALQALSWYSCLKKISI